MNKRQYREYEKAVADFFAREGVNGLSADEHDDSFFSHTPCECCERPLGGKRYRARGYNPIVGDVFVYSVCTDCVYYAEYGQLDDETMISVETSDINP